MSPHFSYRTAHTSSVERSGDVRRGDRATPRSPTRQAKDVRGTPLCMIRRAGGLLHRGSSRCVMWRGGRVIIKLVLNLITYSTKRTHDTRIQNGWAYLDTCACCMCISTHFEIFHTSLLGDRGLAKRSYQSDTTRRPQTPAPTGVAPVAKDLTPYRHMVRTHDLGVSA